MSLIALSGEPLRIAGATASGVRIVVAGASSGSMLQAHKPIAGAHVNIAMHQSPWVTKVIRVF